MPERNVEQDGLYGRINDLEEEIADLKYNNQKLYKDCVTFAKKLKKIQVSGILDEDIDGLKDLNQQYADEIARLKEQIVQLTIENQNMRVADANRKAEALQETMDAIEEELPVVLEGKKSTIAPVEDLYSDSIAVPSKETLENADVAEAARTGNTVSFAKLPPLEEDEEPEIGPAMKRSNTQKIKLPPNATAPAGTRTAKKKGPTGRRVLRAILKTLLTLVILLGLVSGIIGLYAHNFTDSTFLGIRCYTVRNDNMAPNVEQSDVVVVKHIDMNKLQPSNVIQTTYNGRSLAAVEAIETRDNVDYLVVADNAGNSYSITEDEYQGKAVYKIANIGRLTKYALTHRINYFAILLSLAMILIALLILFPSKRLKRKDQPKFGRDYTVEDFTI